MKSAAFPGIAAMFNAPPHTPPHPENISQGEMRNPCQLPLIMVLIAFDAIKDEFEGPERWLCG